jgi:hypothetical protein
MTGPLIVFGQNPAQAGTNYQPDYNGDSGPSAFAGGTMLLDPRYGYRAPLQAGTLSAVGFYAQEAYLLVDQVPSTLSNTAIAAAQATVASTPMTLVSASGAGIVISTTALVVPQSGLTLPAGTAFIQSAPAIITFGQNAAVGCLDPRFQLSRAVSITSNAGATGTTFTVRGTSDFGYPLTEVITQVAGTTVNGKKAFKAIFSVTPATTDAGHTYSVGTTDIFGFAMAAYNFQQVTIYWNNTDITASTGFVAADVTTPATGVTGDVRGTYAVQTASDGTKRLQISVTPAPQNVATNIGPASLFGVQNFAG